MKIATWNVNSVRAREGRLLAWLAKHEPTFLCLQELKVEEDKFPALEVRGAGYEAAVYGQKTYNGVAILSREAPDEVRRGMDDRHDDPQARLLCARFGSLHVVSAYFPNGAAVGSDKYRYKLEWMGRLRAFLDRRFAPTDEVVLAGDFNVAPRDADVNRVDEWANTTLTHADVRAALEHIRGFGLVDVFEKHHPEGGIYSWWDYRMLGFPKNNGLRIDHLFMTESLATRTKDAYVDRDERKGKSPSDHAPVVVELD